MKFFGELRERYGALVEEFGTVAVATYFTLFFGTWFSFWAAIRLGFQVEGAAAGAGTVGAAYVATKITQPARIAATLVLTPIVYRARGWWTSPSEEAP